MSKAKDRPRLGRGLSTLISVADNAIDAPSSTISPVSSIAIAPSDDRPTDGPHEFASDRDIPASLAIMPMMLEIPIETISANPLQPRRQFDPASLAELAASLKSNGMIQPIALRKAATGYQLIAGERRWRAAKLAGLTHVPAVIREVDGYSQAQMALVENIQREDLNAIDRAAAYKTLIEQLGLTQAELAARLGEDRSSIANFLRLLDLALPVRNLVQSGKLSVGHAKLLAGVLDPIEQERVANLVVGQELSVRSLERILQGGEVNRPSRVAAPASAHLQDLEKSMARQLGMRVQLRAVAGKGKGRVVIHFSNLDQFDELMSRMGIQSE